MKLFRPLLAVLAVAAVFALVIADADARPRMSAGSRGSKTFSAPPPTATAPNAAAPINRTMTTPGTPGMATTGSASAGRAAAAACSAAHAGCSADWPPACSAPA